MLDLHTTKSKDYIAYLRMHPHQAKVKVKKKKYNKHQRKLSFSLALYLSVNVPLNSIIWKHLFFAFEFEPKA